MPIHAAHRRAGQQVAQVARGGFRSATGFRPRGHRRQSRVQTRAWWHPCSGRPPAAPRRRAGWVAPALAAEQGTAEALVTFRRAIESLGRL